MKWEKVKLGELYEVYNGLSKAGKFFGEGYPFLTFSTVFNNYFIPKQITDLVQSTEKEQESYSIRRGDVFVTRTSETSDELGMSCVALKDYPMATYNGFTKRMRPITNRVFPEYIGYYMRLPSFRGEFRAFSTMTTRASLRNEDLLGLEVKLPSIEIQKQIADILSAYDDLIENNQKQIKLLEEAAQRLYKEWFVDLRFPGHENTKIVDGVPEGWSKNPIQDFISYEIGGGWGEELQNEKSMIPAYVIRGTDIKGLVNGQLQSVPYRYHTAGSLETRKLRDGDIVFEVSGGSKTEGVARTVRIIDLMLKTWENSVICASFCKRIKPIPSFSQYLYDSFRWMRLNGKTQEYDKKSASSIVNYRWKDFLAQEKILKPDEETISRYNNIAGTIYTKIIVCSCQIEQAKMKRDLLLPKLMNGEVEV